METIWVYHAALSGLFSSKLRGRFNVSMPEVISCKEDAFMFLGRTFGSMEIHDIASLLSRIENYTMVFTGEESYVHGKRELLEFTEIRRLGTHAKV